MNETVVEVAKTAVGAVVLILAGALMVGYFGMMAGLFALAYRAVAG